MFVPFNIRRIVAAIALAVLSVLIFYLVKKRSVLSIYKGQVSILMLIIGLLYLMIYYIPAVEYGFYKNLYALDKLAIFKYIIPISVIIITIEFIRRIMLAQNEKSVTILFFITAIFADVLIFANHQSINSFDAFIDITISLKSYFSSNDA